jgi:hypothetical protein
MREIKDNKAVVVYPLAGDPHAPPTTLWGHSREIHAHVDEVIIDLHQTCCLGSRLVNVLHEAVGWVRSL